MKRTDDINSEVDCLNVLKKEGFTTNFIFKDGVVQDSEDYKSYTPADLTIVDEFRFEGKTNPSDMSIIYALRSNDGKKGSIVVGYGPAGNLEAANFFSEVTVNSIKNGH